MLILLVRSHLKPYRRSVGILAALQFVQAALVLYLPILNAAIIDNGVVKGDTRYILRVGGVMLAAALLQALCAVAAVRHAARTAMAVGRDLRALLFERVVSFSSREMGRFGVASLITRSTNDVQQIQLLVLMTGTLMVSTPFICAGAVVLALGQDVPLSAILLVVIPVLGVLAGLILSRMRPLVRSMQERIDTLNRILREQIAGVRVIRAFAKDDHERQRFSDANVGLAAVALPVGRLSLLMLPLGSVVVNTLGVPVVWFGAHRIADGSMRVGALAAFLLYLALILNSVTTATFLFMMLPRAEVCAERIGEVLGTDAQVRPPAAPVRCLHGSGLELRGVDFRYPGAQEAVLRGVDFTAEPGEVVAVIGSTGSGKSSLLELVPRLADASRGQVLVGGVDVRALEPALLARVVGLVPQKPYLFSGTVASNLRFGRPDAGDEELWQALEVSQARRFVEQLPDGLEAPVAQGGSNFSGGQRQRLAIARTLVQRPDIYLFDDSFSALDYSTEAALRNTLSREITGATVVVVAQRLSTIRSADRIVVLEAGRIVATGTHRQLMESSPTYHEIVLSQLSETDAL